MSQPRASLGFDWTMTALSLLFLGGAFLDGWAHTHGRVDQSFLTPWHAGLYGGYLATASALVAVTARNVRRGYLWRHAAPAGYGLSLLGVGLWFVGGPADLVWHELFGFEADVEALLSPAHLLLAVGAGLILGGPFRAASRRGTPESWARRLPPLLSLTFGLSLATFFTQIAHPLANLWAAGTARPPSAALAQELGVVSILFNAALMMGAVMIAQHRELARPGAFTLMFTVNGVAMGFLYDHGPYPTAAVVAFAAGGVVTDVLRGLLRPAPDRLASARLFAFLVPAALHTLYFVCLRLTDGLWWSVHVWVGTIVFAGVLGWLLSYLAVLPRVNGPAARPA
jgi:hypothetical protein